MYDAADVARLATICRLRRAGLPLAEIARTLDSATPQLVAALAVRLGELGDQIEMLRGHQRTILAALAAGREGDRTWSLDKAALIGLLDAAGIGPDRQQEWHAAAESADGELHQRLLESLDLSADEVTRIRERGRGAVAPCPRDAPADQPRVASSSGTGRCGTPT